MLHCIIWCYVELCSVAGCSMTVLRNIVWCCISLYGVVRSCVVVWASVWGCRMMHHITWCCTVIWCWIVHGNNAWCCIVLCTCMMWRVLYCMLLHNVIWCWLIDDVAWCCVVYQTVAWYTSWCDCALHYVTTSATQSRSWLPMDIQIYL